MWFFFEQYKIESLSKLRSEKLDYPHPLKSFLDELHLNANFSKDCIFLITSYILCIFCARDNDGIPSAINFNEIKNAYKITNISLDKTIHNLQAINAELSCEHISKLTKKLYSLNVSRWLNLQQLIGDYARKAFPCYVLTKTILDDMLAKHAKMVFIISDQHNQQIKLLYHAKAKKFLLLENSEDINCNMIVFKGITHMDLTNASLLKQRIREIDPYQIILSNMAKHPQFTGKKLNYLKNQPFHNFPEILNSEIIGYMEYYEQMINLAEKIGTYQDNVRLFYIKHIFCMQTSSTTQQSSVRTQGKINYAYS